MIAAIRAALFALALAWSLGATPARAGTLVEFPNVTEQSNPPHLLGYLARPESGPGPFPAVVVLHGCQGMAAGGSLQLADQFKDWGYVGLAVDSLGPRGLGTGCGGLFNEQATDAFAALKFLSRQSFVIPDRIAALGSSMGGTSALTAVGRGFFERAFAEKFAAAIAFYPACAGHSPLLNAPALILIGAEDETTPAVACRHLVAQPHAEDAPIELVVYPGAHHGFNFAILQPGRRASGHWQEYNEAAAKDAEARVRNFLATHLGPGRQ